MLQEHAPRRWKAIFLSISALALSHSSPARADEPAPTESSAVGLSERRAAEAFQAYTRKEYSAAVALYLEAHEAAPSGSILYNVARIYDMKLGDRPLAIVYYRRYIADPGAYTERIEVANQRLSELRKAELSASKLVEPSASSEPPARAPRERPLPQALSEPSREDRNAWSTLRWSGVAVGVVGLTGIGVGAGFGLAAMSKAKAADESCQGNACTSQRGVDAANAAATDATISNIGLTAGGALLVTGAALFVLGARKPSEQSSRADIRLEPRVTSSATSLQLSGKW